MIPIEQIRELKPGTTIYGPNRPDGATIESVNDKWVNFEGRTFSKIELIAETFSLKPPACRRCTEGKSLSSDKCAFSTGKFSAENYACATMLRLRELILLRNDPIAALPAVMYNWHEDQHVATIVLGSIGFESDHPNQFPVALFITWAKNRGRTESFHILNDRNEVFAPTERDINHIIELLEKL